MNVKTLVTVSALTALITTSGGSAFALGDPHDAYNRAFLGKTISQTTGPMNEVADQNRATAPAWSGHDAYNYAFLGKSPNKAEPDSIGKAAYGTSSSSDDGFAAYQRAFHGD